MICEGKLAPTIISLPLFQFRIMCGVSVCGGGGGDTPQTGCKPVAGPTQSDNSSYSNSCLCSI